jgi:hypothetical protein
MLNTATAVATAILLVCAVKAIPMDKPGQVQAAGAMGEAPVAFACTACGRDDGMRNTRSSSRCTVGPQIHEGLPTSFREIEQF